MNSVTDSLASTFCRMRERIRLDALMVERGLFESRSRAAAAVMAGDVHGRVRGPAKPGTLVARTQRSRRGRPRYVSRGGLKLERALECFDVAVEGRRCLDVGASTGGFTDCLLQRGAARVTCVDVGYGELDWRLREDTIRTDFRVVLMTTSRRLFIAAAATVAATNAGAAAAVTTYPKLVHHVFFWLKNPDSKEDLAKLLAGLRTLAKMKPCAGAHFGVPASTEKRDVVDNSFSASEILFFDDTAGQKVYQDHPIHGEVESGRLLAFVRERAVVYDAMAV